MANISTEEYTLSDEEKRAYKAWLQSAWDASAYFDGSEAAAELLIARLQLMEDFIKAKTGARNDALELEFARSVLQHSAAGRSLTISDVLQDTASRYYGKLEKPSNLETILNLLEHGGAVVEYHSGTFIKTADGSLNQSQSDDGENYEIYTKSRLAVLVRRLREEGIYTDDMIVHVAKVDPAMMRKMPYIVVQIPRLNKEIAICDQVGEITFAAHKIIGPLVWEHVDKERLKERDDISTIAFNNEEQWWSEIRDVLLDGTTTPKVRYKIDVTKFAQQKPPLDTDLIKLLMIAEHELPEHHWANENDGLVRAGPYAGIEKWPNIGVCLRQGIRGLPGGSSLKILREEIDIPYGNHKRQIPLDSELINQSMLAEHELTGIWPGRDSGVVKAGPYKGLEAWNYIELASVPGKRGLEGGVTLADRREQLDAGYRNPAKRPNLKRALIKSSMRAEYKLTGIWPGRDSGKVKAGVYKDLEEWSHLDKALKRGDRGLEGGSSVADIRVELDPAYTNRMNAVPLVRALIKQSILEEYLSTLEEYSTGIWPTQNHGLVKAGPYKDKEDWGNINTCAYHGRRGLPGGSSLPELNQEVAEENGLVYKKGHGWKKKQKATQGPSAPAFE